MVERRYATASAQQEPQSTCFKGAGRGPQVRTSTGKAEDWTTWLALAAQTRARRAVALGAAAAAPPPGFFKSPARPRRDGDADPP